MPDKKVIRAVKQKADAKTGPDGTGYESLSVTAVASLARSLGMPRGFIEITALENGIIPERYIRNMQTLSIDDQISLLKATVCIVGLGGLGGTVTELLARLGVGALTLVDGDTFEDSNLNRQILSTEQAPAASKAEAASARVSEINASVEIRTCPEFLNHDNARRLIRNAAVVIDCLDNIKTRFILENATRHAGIPLVSAAVAGQIGQVSTIFPEDTGFRLIYGDPETAVSSKGAETLLGTPPYTVSLAASLEVSEATKVLLKKQPLKNRLLVFDLDQNTFEMLHLE